MLRNPIDYGDFVWEGTLYRGSDEPLISKKLFDAVPSGELGVRDEFRTWFLQNAA